MPETRVTRRLGYALNVFPGHTLAELWPCLETDVLQLKQRAFSREVFPIELRFSEPLVRELRADPREVARLKSFLDTHGLALITANAFVMPRFHGERVKERVYLPAWHESDARAQFTDAALELLAQLAPRDTAFISASVPFGALKPASMAAIAPPILECGRQAARLSRRAGIRCVVALEPEPGLTVETTAEAVEFFERFVPVELWEHLAVNFDLAHQLVEFEDLGESLARLRAAGVGVAKVHVSNAAELTALRPFYADSIYLHQVCGVDVAGERVFFSLDWPEAPPPTRAVRFRVHYHLPVCPVPVGEPGGPGTTLAEVERFLTEVLPHPSATPPLDPATPLIIETYTWPEHRRGRQRLVENLVGELDWVRQKISLVPNGGTAIV